MSLTSRLKSSGVGVQILLMVLLHRAQIHRLFDNLVAIFSITVQAPLLVICPHTSITLAIRAMRNVVRASPGVDTACIHGSGEIGLRSA